MNTERKLFSHLILKDNVKSFVFCTSYIDERNPELTSGRYTKWVRYYQPLLKEIGAEQLFLFDDGSNQEDLLRIKGVNAIVPAGTFPETFNDEVAVVSFPDHLGRTSGFEYRGWWRSFTYSAALAENYAFDRIIHIESDFYLLSTRLKQFIRDIRHGWTSLYSRIYAFPETAMQVICKESFPRLHEIYDLAQSNNYTFQKEAELVLPFTEVNREFTGDRIGEFWVFQQWAAQIKNDLEFDYIGQLRPEINTPSSAELNNLFSTFNKRSTGNIEEDVNLLMEFFRSNNLLEKID